MQSWNRDELEDKEERAVVFPARLGTVGVGVRPYQPGDTVPGEDLDASVAPSGPRRVEIACARSGDLGPATKEERSWAFRGDRASGLRLEEPRGDGVVGTTSSSRDPVTDPSWVREIARGTASLSR